MRLALGIEVQGLRERLGALFVGHDAVQAGVLHEAIGTECWEVDLTHEGEECSLSRWGEDEGRII